MKIPKLEKAHLDWVANRTKSGSIENINRQQAGMVRLNTLFPHKQVMMDTRVVNDVLVSGYFSRKQMLDIVERIKISNENAGEEVFHPLGLLQFIGDISCWTGIPLVEIGVLCKDKKTFEDHCDAFRSLFPLHDILFHCKPRKTQNNADIFLDSYKIIRMLHIPYKNTCVAALFWLSLPMNVKKFIQPILYKKNMSLSERGLFHNNTLIHVNNYDQITNLLGLPDNYLMDYFNTPTKQGRHLLKGNVCKAYPSVKQERKRITLIKKAEAVQEKEAKTQEILMAKEAQQKQKQELKNYEDFKKWFKQQKRIQHEEHKEQRNTELSSGTITVTDESSKARDAELRKKTAKVLKNIRRKGIRISGASVPISQK